MESADSYVVIESLNAAEPRKVTRGSSSSVVFHKHGRDVLAAKSTDGESVMRVPAKRDAWGLMGLWATVAAVQVSSLPELSECH